jgi:hypothetical protein
MSSYIRVVGSIVRVYAFILHTRFFLLLEEEEEEMEDELMPEFFASASTREGRKLLQCSVCGRQVVVDGALSKDKYCRGRGLRLHSRMVMTALA